MAKDDLLSSLQTLPSGSKGVVYGLTPSSLETHLGHYFIFTKNSSGVITFLDGQAGSAAHSLSGSSMDAFRVMEKK